MWIRWPDARGMGGRMAWNTHWFVRKAMWASQASIKSNAASLKKFYVFLFEKGLIKKEDLNELEETIKDEMPEWLAELKQYDDESDIEDF